MFEFFSHISDTSSLYHPPSPPATVTSAAPTPPVSTQGKQVFIRLFVFQPALPIKIDYTTKWRFPTDTMGTLPGILISLYHLDNSELTLKALNCKTGFLGWDSLLECVAREWSTDIMSRQLPLILKGVGPTHYITQFVHGVVDLVRLPYHQYQEDGRIVWGLQQGASSFSASTGLAVVELTSRTLETLQSVAQMVYDLVTPVPAEGHASQGPSQRRAPHQPQDFREGVSNAYDVVASGLTGAAVDLYTVASVEHEERGVTGAVGGYPPTDPRDRRETSHTALRGHPTRSGRSQESICP
ncbi:Autophagy-related protein 2 homolog B [Geodia barretti]|uniref:Autophagy-related protein 2 n=1 Tax=Geodia barretti TaxID=519541 RepID=A0AA35RYJ1_GEOBA|nr:Autophagy-related protein 2 homolog B [Geodia barretti]